MRAGCGGPCAKRGRSSCSSTSTPAIARPAIRGLLSLPGREQEFDKTVRDGLVLARWLGTRLLNVPAGNLPEGVPAAAVRAVTERNLVRAVDRASAEGVTMLVEPLNRVDRPGYAMVSLPEAARLVRAVDSPYLRLQFDIYHAGVRGDPLAALRRVWPLIGHVQLADHPGRHQPGTGRLPIAAVLTELERRRYQGLVGLEYVPLGETGQSLAWMSSPPTTAPDESAPVQ